VVFSGHDHVPEHGNPPPSIDCFAAGAVASPAISPTGAIVASGVIHRQRQ
jgi:hypothetical protein